jgi:intein/homing endonuclease
MTAEGPKQVADLIGRRFTAIVNGKKWNSNSEGFFFTGVKPVYKLLTKEGFELHLTKDHPIMKIERKNSRKKFKWVKAEELRKNDKILLNNHSSIDFWSGPYSFDEGYIIGSFIMKNMLKIKENYDGNTNLNGNCINASGYSSSLILLTTELKEDFLVKLDKTSSSFCKGLLQVYLMQTVLLKKEEGKLKL